MTGKVSRTKSSLKFKCFKWTYVSKVRVKWNHTYIITCNYYIHCRQWVTNYLPGCLLDPIFSSNVVLFKSFFFFRSVCFYCIHSSLTACRWVHQLFQLFIFFMNNTTRASNMKAEPDSAWPGLNVTVRIWPYQNKTEEKREGVGIKNAHFSETHTLKAEFCLSLSRSSFLPRCHLWFKRSVER